MMELNYGFIIVINTFMRKFISYLLFPISILYGLAIHIRNKLYDLELIKSQKQNVITIGIGNIKVGGTGKTPHVEFLIELLSKHYKVGVLSRGYKRKTKGFILLNENDNPLKVGDEALQIKNKYPMIPVAVCEDRNKGIKEIKKCIQDIELIILDDVFQHRKLKLDFSFLLTEYSNPFFNDSILPFGNLREPKKGYKRADYIIVTKTPKNISIGERTFFESKLKPKKYQKLFYSNIKYNKAFHLFNNEIILDCIENRDIILVTGIADNTQLINYIEGVNSNIIEKIEKADHYNFMNKDIGLITQKYNSHIEKNPIIITTEKDAVKLREFTELKDNNIPIFVLPITVNLIYSNLKTQSFEQTLLDDVRKNKSYG